MAGFCDVCKQDIRIGQTGSSPCPKCGMPRIWDKKVRGWSKHDFDSGKKFMKYDKKYKAFVTDIDLMAVTPGPYQRFAILLKESAKKHLEKKANTGVLESLE